MDFTILETILAELQLPVYYLEKFKAEDVDDKILELALEDEDLREELQIIVPIAGHRIAILNAFKAYLNNKQTVLKKKKRYTKSTFGTQTTYRSTVSGADGSPETPLLGSNNPSTKLAVRNTILVGALFIIGIGSVLLITGAALHGVDPVDDDPCTGAVLGKPCNITAKATERGSCKTDLFLTCDKDTSVCRCENGMFIDTNSDPERCVAKAGENCSNYVEEGLPIKHCTRNAECLPDPFGVLRCNCKRNCLPNYFGACVASYDGHCSIDAECIPNSFLKCGPGQNCTCDFLNDSQVWNDTLRQCASMIEAVCTPADALERPCIDPEKSFCQKDVNGYICKCKPGFIPSSGNHRCAVPYNGACDITADCADHFVCDQEKKCGCQNAKDQLYDFVQSKCIAYASASCIDLDGKMMGCVENATCSVRLPGHGSICICDEKFHDENRFCKLNSGKRTESVGLALFSVAGLMIAQYLNCMN